MSSGIDLQQFHDFVAYPTLEFLGLNSKAARRLLLGTIAHESLGTSLDQILGPSDRTLGPAIGLYQIEPATHDDLYENYLAFHQNLKEKVMSLRARQPDPHVQLATNLAYATAIARLIYWRQPEALPAEDDIEGLANYWKTYYNTPAGAGTPSQWGLHYSRDVRSLDFTNPQDRSTM